MASASVAGPRATIRLSAVLAAVSLASDVGHDQPLEKSLRNAVIASRLGMELGLARQDLSDAYYVALLRSMGCTANAHETATLFGGDDRAVAGMVQILDVADPVAWARAASERVRSWAADAAAERTIEWFLREGRRLGRESGRAACEVATTLARRLGLAPSVQTGLDQVYERWDGYGAPRGLVAEEICVAARVAHLADVVEIVDRTSGTSAAREVAGRRAGRHFDPEVAAAFERAAGEILSGLDGVDMLELAQAAEPGPAPRVAREDLAELAAAIADFGDLKSPWTLGHSTAVADLVVRAAGPDGADELRLAALLHDLGRVAVPNGIWDKPGPLGTAQRERVRLHSYYTERILARTPAFAGLATLAGSDHERVDGVGYHRGVGGDALTGPMRMLACADAYVAMTSARPYRPALAAAVAATELRAAARAGGVCPDATEAVLEAAGHRRERRQAAPCGLTAREVEVLGLLARGLTNKQIAGELFVSARTVGHHVAHVYDKIDRRTRAGAAMFALEHRLIVAGPD